MVRKDGAGKILIALALGLLLGMLVTLTGAAVTAFLISAQKIPVDGIGDAAMLTILLASATAALIVSAKAQGLRIVMCLAGGGVYFLGLLCCGAVLFDGVRGGVFPSFAVTMCGSILIWLLGVKGGRKQKYKVPKMRI